MLPNIPTSQQPLRSYYEIADAIKRSDITEDYFQLKTDNDNLRNALVSLISMVSGGDFSPLSGSGSPEGVVAANYSQLYIDTVAPAIYYNPTLGAETGWVLL